jgi:7-cyano-7-deazaguanine synthase
MIGDTTALVLLSGGQDSAVCLAWALDRFDLVETIGFDYRQRHRVELECRDRLRTSISELRHWRGALQADHVIDLSVLSEISETALTRETEFAFSASGLPNTFVPGRNLAFLTLAAAIAYRRGARHLVTGVCETDFSGYPDCRDDTMKALQVALNLGMERRYVIHTPLMWLDKAATWTLAAQLGGEALVDLVIEHTHSCYRGERAIRHAWGHGCGTCPACELRAGGWNRYVAGGGIP